MPLRPAPSSEGTSERIPHAADQEDLNPPPATEATAGTVHATLRLGTALDAGDAGGLVLAVRYPKRWHKRWGYRLTKRGRSA